MGSIPLRSRFTEIDVYIKIFDGIRYLVLFGPGSYDEIYDRITDSINHDFGTIRIDSYNSLTIEKILIFDNAVVLIKSVDNNDKNQYYYNILLEKDSYKGKSNTQYF